MDTVITYLTLSFIVSFLLGSIPWGVIVSKLAFHKDIRDEGSGNIGTTNAIRTMGKVGGYAVFVLDFGKGLLSGVLAWAFSMQFLPGGGLEPGALVTYDTMLAVAFLGCVWGHIFCPWLGFKGGKGIAVAVGCLFVTFASSCSSSSCSSWRRSACPSAPSRRLRPARSSRCTSSGAIGWPGCSAPSPA